MNTTNFTVEKPSYMREARSLGVLLWRIRVGRGYGKFNCQTIFEPGHPIFKECKAIATTDVSGSTAEAFGGRKSRCRLAGINPEDRHTGKLEFITGCGVGAPGQESTFRIDIQGNGMQQDLKLVSYDAVNHFNQKAISDFCSYNGR